MPNSAEKPMSASRLKTWEEFDDKQKIGHLKENIKDLARAVVDLDGIVSKLLQHNHMDGRIVMPIANPNHESDGSVIHLPYSLRHPERR